MIERIKKFFAGNPNPSHQSCPCSNIEHRHSDDAIAYLRRENKELENNLFIATERVIELDKEFSEARKICAINAASDFQRIKNIESDYQGAEARVQKLTENNGELEKENRTLRAEIAFLNKHVCKATE